MLKEIDIVPVLVVAGIAIIFAGELLLPSEPPQQQSTVSQTNDESLNKAREVVATEQMARYTLWLERFTGLLAIVSAFQIYFLIRADGAAKISANAASPSYSAIVG